MHVFFQKLKLQLKFKYYVLHTTFFKKRLRLFKMDFLVLSIKDVTRTWTPDLTKKGSLIFGRVQKSSLQSFKYYRPNLLLVRGILIKKTVFLSCYIKTVLIWIRTRSCHRLRAFTFFLTHVHNSFWLDFRLRNVPTP